MASKDSLIETGVDRLLAYVREEEKVTVEEATDALGADKKRVLNWASSLEDANLIEVRYSARKGRILTSIQGKVTEDDLEAAREGTRKELGKITGLKDEKELERFQEILEHLEQVLEEKEVEILKLEGVLDDDRKKELEHYRYDLIESEVEVDELESRLENLIAGMNVLEMMAEEVGYDVEEEEKEGFLAKVKTLLHLEGGDKRTFKCRDCGKEFESQHGVKVHRGLMHHE